MYLSALVVPPCTLFSAASAANTLKCVTELVTHLCVSPSKAVGSYWGFPTHTPVTPVLCVTHVFLLFAAVGSCLPIYTVVGRLPKSSKVLFWRWSGVGQGRVQTVFYFELSTESQLQYLDQLGSEPPVALVVRRLIRRLHNLHRHRLKD